jgi:hypothetical protein
MMTKTARTLGMAALLALAWTPASASAETDAQTPANSEAPAAAPAAPYRSENRSVSLQDLADRNRLTGVWDGSPQVQARRDWYHENFYATLASQEVWKDGTGPFTTHKFQGPITWDIVAIPQKAPPPCSEPQTTGYDTDSCRYVNSLFAELEKTDPAAARIAREQVRRGRDVWYKGTFGNQDEIYEHFSRAAGGIEFIRYPWLHTSERKHRFTEYGLINDPDCTEGDASTFWMDRCDDPHSSGVLGYRKYPAPGVVKTEDGKTVFDPNSEDYNQRFVIGHPCVQCHVAFDPTTPPANPNEPEWDNIHALIGNQYIVQPLMFFQGTPRNSPIRQVLKGGRPGTIDTSLVANDFQHNPGTQNNIMDFFNKRVFEHEIKHPVTGEVKTANTLHVLKGGEDSVGEHLALIRVYVNIGMCTEECWAPKFPKPGAFFGKAAAQQPFSIEQCARDCEAWNYADAKMPDLAAFLITGGPTYLMKAVDVDGTPGSAFVDTTVIPRGREVFIRECASCHSSKMAPDAIRADKEALVQFYEGHVFGREEDWALEFRPETVEDPAFRNKYLSADGRPKQFAENAVFGQDWLSNDEPVPFHLIGTNRCRALHDNHNAGQIWEEFSSETYKQRPSPGSVPQVTNRMVPLVGGIEMGSKTIEGGPGYYRNFSLLSVWATAPFLHNNAIGELTTLDDGKTLDTSVRGRIKQFEMAFDELMMSDDPAVTPSRPVKISVTDTDIKIAPREDMQGPIKLPVHEGTPVAHFASSNPHRPLFMKCDDLVENKGHQFGVSLPDADKRALREFLKVL